MRSFRFLRGDIGSWWSRIFPGAPMTTPPDTPNEVLDVVQPVQDIFGSALHTRRSLWTVHGDGAATGGGPFSPAVPANLTGLYAFQATAVPADEIWICDKLFSYHEDAATRWGTWIQLFKDGASWCPLTGRTAMGQNEVYCPVGLHTVVTPGQKLGVIWDPATLGHFTFGFQYVPLKIGETLNPTAV